jgi:ComF family protein
MIIEYIIRLISPHLCYSCGSEGRVLCRACIKVMPKPPQSKVTGLIGNLFVATIYTGVARQVVHALKFNNTKAAARDIGVAIASRLPELYRPDIVTYVPTATSRVRSRGYDQAALIAKAVARSLGVPCTCLLMRQGQQRQVGSDKRTREAQLLHAFRAKPIARNQTILLVDDILTTGSTLRAASAVLHGAGARHVDVAVFATGRLK